MECMRYTDGRRKLIAAGITLFGAEFSKPALAFAGLRFSEYIKKMSEVLENKSNSMRTVKNTEPCISIRTNGSCKKLTSLL